MNGEPYKRPRRYLIAVLYVSVTFCVMLPYIAPSVVMGDMMTGFGIGLDLAGLAMTIVLVMAGICFFIGSFIQDKIGALNTIKLCMVSVSVGGLITAFAPNITVFLIGRVVVGFGYGLSVGLTPYINTWFQGNALSYVLTFNSLGSAVAMAISAGFSVKLAALMGSWQGIFKIYAAVAIAFTILWFIFGKNSPEGEAQEQAIKEQQAAGGKRQSSLGLALREGQFWKIAIFAIIYIVVDTSRATYMPTYLISRGISEVTANTATSMFSIIGMVGSLAGGVLATRIWRRKLVMTVALICFMLCGLGTTFLPGMAAVVLSVALGFFFNVQVTSQSNLIIESAMAKNPASISGAFALANGTGMLLTLVVSPAFTAIASSAGMGMAYRVFFAVCLVGILAVLTARESGRKPEKKTAAQ